MNETRDLDMMQAEIQHIIDFEGIAAFAEVSVVPEIVDGIEC